MTHVYLLLGLTAIATGALLVYTHWVLPRQVGARYSDSFRVFSQATELRFPSHEGLSERVQLLAVAVARRLRLGREAIKSIEDAAQLRDLGMCAIPYRLLNDRLYDQWSEAERATYYRHAEVGGAMLDLIPTLKHLAPIVRASHTEYRDQPDAPIGSRILCAVTEYVWTEAREGGAQEAMVMLEAGKGVRFDPVVVAALRAVLTSSPV